MIFYRTELHFNNWEYVVKDWNFLVIVRKIIDCRWRDLDNMHMLAVAAFRFWGEVFGTVECGYSNL